MADVLTRKKRSQVMAAIRSSGNRATEGRLAAIFRGRGVTGWRRCQPVPGRPDFVFRRERIAVFVDGCFWHGCPWHCRMPKSRIAYWRAKIKRNKARDGQVRRLLATAGWQVHRVWEHSLARPQRFISRLKYALAVQKLTA